MARCVDGRLRAWVPCCTTRLYRRAASYVAKVLRGALPADLPVERVTNFEMAVNLKTAKLLDLTIPTSILLRADEVIE